MRSGLEIQAALEKFVAKWKGYSGSEEAEAQSFLNDLFGAYGTDRFEAGALFEDFTSFAGFETFPWSDPVDEAVRETVASAASALYERPYAPFD